MKRVRKNTIIGSPVSLQPTRQSLGEAPGDPLRLRMRAVAPQLVELVVTPELAGGAGLERSDSKVPRVDIHGIDALRPAAEVTSNTASSPGNAQYARR